MKKTSVALIAVAALVASTFTAACGKKGKGTPVNFSEPVGIHMTAGKNDVSSTTNVLSVQKNINTESGNPFGKFVNDAKAKLNGADPSSVGLTSLVLTLSSSSSVTGLEQVFSGPVSILFAMSTSTAIYPVGTVASVSGSAATMSNDFDTSVMTSADYASFLGGQFKVALEGSANPSFKTGNPNADFLATFTFVAYQ